MNTACYLLLSVISSVVLSTSGLDPTPSACSVLASGVLYGSFSLKDLFPTISSSCSWTLENPDPTKYSLYLKFNREEQVCTHLSPMVQPLDHYLSNHSCSHPEEGEDDGLELCHSSSPFTFLHFDKNFLRLCLSAEPVSIQHLTEVTLDSQFVEVLLVNNDNSSQFACSVLCRWFEECMHAGGWSHRCGITQTGCPCPERPSRHNATVSNVIVPAASSDCCVTELHSGNANDLYSQDMKYDDNIVLELCCNVEH